MTTEPKILADGWTNLLGGGDSERNPNLLRADQVAFLVNATCRGGYAATRPRFSPVAYHFADSEIEDWFASQIHQGAEAYEPLEAEAFYLIMVAGRLFKFDVLNDYMVTEITPTKTTTTTANFISPPIDSSITISVSDTTTILVGYPVVISGGKYTVTSKTGVSITATNVTATPGVLVSSPASVIYLDTNASNRPQAWFKQAEQYMVIQDGQARPIIFNGVSARRSLVDTGSPAEVPTGTCMEYTQGRLRVAVNQREIALGDIAGGPTEVINFSEEKIIAGGGRFRVRDPITCLIEMSSQDSAEAEGPMLIGTEKRVYSLDLPITRTLWPSLTDPILPARLISYGPKSQNGTVLVNGDVFFRAIDGLRSFVIARREHGGWGNTPISREMSRVIRTDDRGLLKFSSAVLFDNRLLFTVNPLPLRACSAYWRGIGALDFELLSSMGDKPPPAYDMLWTGIQPMQLTKITLQGQERCFVFAVNAELENECWEIHRETGFDGDNGRIESWLETRSLQFQTPRDAKLLEAFELWVDSIRGKVDFDLKWRPDQFPCWFNWGTDQRCADQFCAEEDVCADMAVYRDGYNPRISFGQPPEEGEEFTNRPGRLFYEVQLRLQWTGHARIKMGLVKAFITDELPNTL